MASHSKQARASMTRTEAAEDGGLLAIITNPPAKAQLDAVHAPPSAFRRGQDLSISLSAPAGQKPPIIHYRRVNQAEVFRSDDMGASNSEYRFTVPSNYTDSPFPLQYYFELQDAAGRACLFPGFNATWTNQPYYVIRQSRPASS
jgi:hypothetical protein